jgi:DNA-binding transcriptional LysR family regulator
MSLNPQRLRILLAVVRADGVVGAARALRLTPQAVSQQLGLLERELDVSLFDRSRRRLAPTQLARELAGHAERVEAELVAAERTAASSTSRATGTVRVAAFQSVIRWLVVEALPLVRARQPGVTPVIVEMSGPGVLTELRAGRLDLVIDDRDESMPASPSPSIATRLLRREPYFVVASAALAHKLRTPRQLAAQRWIDGPEGSACRAALRRLAARARFEPHISHVCLEFPSILALVRAGEGIAIVPAPALGDRISYGLHRRSNSAGPSLRSFRSLGQEPDSPGFARSRLEDAGAVETCPITGLGTRDLYLLQRTTARGTAPAVDAVIDALLAIQDRR